MVRINYDVEVHAFSLVIQSLLTDKKFIHAHGLPVVA